MASALGPGLVCYLCGRQFGSASLQIHQRTCRLRFEREHGRPAPKAPTSNAAAAQVFEAEVLEACPHCGRTFLPDRLEVHLRSCGRGRPPAPSSKGAADPSPLRSAGSTPRRLETAPSPKPALPVCHLCGRQFGSASLQIHQRTCRLRFEREHGRPAPEAPATNAAASQLFEAEVLKPCPHCGRTFLPDRLEVHLRSCKGPPPARAPRGQSVEAAPSTPPSGLGRVGSAPRSRASPHQGGGPSATAAAARPLSAAPRSARAAPPPRAAAEGEAAAWKPASPPEAAPQRDSRPASRAPGSSTRAEAGSPSTARGARPIQERMVELKALFDAALISEAEFQAKREQILADL